MHMMYEMILQRYGWEEGWQVLTLLGAKTRAFDRSSATTAKEITTGDVAYALAIDFYAMTQIASVGPDNAGFVLPRDCVIVNPDGIAILHGAPHEELARRFVEFCLSDDGQKLLLLPRGSAGGALKFSIERMSIRPDLYDRYRNVTLVPINPFAQPISFQYDAAKGAARWSIVDNLIGATIIDVHPELVKAFQKQIARSGQAVFEQLGRPPISEAEAMRLARSNWGDPSFRNRTLIDWQRWAIRNFRGEPQAIP